MGPQLLRVVFLSLDDYAFSIDLNECVRLQIYYLLFWNALRDVVALVLRSYLDDLLLVVKGCLQIDGREFVCEPSVVEHDLN